MEKLSCYWWHSSWPGQDATDFGLHVIYLAKGYAQVMDSKGFNYFLYFLPDNLGWQLHETFR